MMQLWGLACRVLVKDVTRRLDECHASTVIDPRRAVRLAPGSRVLIAGGGPAGSFSALHLLHYARQAGLDLEVILLEPRDFGQPGPGGCNKSAGIFSSTLIRVLQGLGLRLSRA